MSAPGCRATGLLTNIGTLVSLQGGEGPLPGRVRDVGTIRNAAVAWLEDRIVWTGPAAAAALQVDLAAGTSPEDAGGGCLIPGMVDAHTHLIFDGDREDEWEARLRGESYAEIAARGGGILKTVRATREASPARLRGLLEARLERSLRRGVTTVEVKSGYGLSLESELRCLEILAEVNRAGRFEVVPTFLGAHELGPEFHGRRSEFVAEVSRNWIPEVARRGLAEFFDVFCEKGVFELDDTRAMGMAARAAGLGLKLHADEFYPLGGAGLAAELGAVSADHLLCATEGDLALMQEAGTLPVLLPGTSLLMGLPWAPAKTMLDLGLALVVASDCNPGTCPTAHLPLLGGIALGGYRLEPWTALAAITRNAAFAVGRGDRLGRLEPGYQMDAVLLQAASPAGLLTQLGEEPARAVWKRGVKVAGAGVLPGTP